MSAVKSRPGKHVKRTKTQPPRGQKIEAKAPKTIRPKDTSTRLKKRIHGEAKKLSALNAAARVLSEAGQPMTAREMIDAMAAHGYWTSPGGKTPAATLY